MSGKKSQEKEQLEFIYEITESEINDIRGLLNEALDLLKQTRAEPSKEAKELIKDALAVLEEIDEEKSDSDSDVE